jgi:hypothetical protein
MAKHGVIYILHNERHGDNVFKIGETYDLDKRKAELERETSNVGNFKTVATFPVSNTKRAEKECHRALSRFRVHPRKEFFEGNQSEIISIVENIVSKYKPENEYHLESKYSEDLESYRIHPVEPEVVTTTQDGYEHANKKKDEDELRKEANARWRKKLRISIIVSGVIFFLAAEGYLESLGFIGPILMFFSIMNGFVAFLMCLIGPKE